MKGAIAAFLYTLVAGVGFTFLVPPLGITLIVMTVGTAAFVTVMDRAVQARGI